MSRDRAMEVRECDFCYERQPLDTLVRMTMNYPDIQTDVFDMILCSRCIDYMRAHYCAIAPQLQRYYHPA